MIGGSEKIFTAGSFLNECFGNAILAAPPGSKKVKELLTMIKSKLMKNINYSWELYRTKMRFQAAMYLTGPCMFKDFLVVNERILEKIIMENITGPLFQKVKASAEWRFLPERKSYQVRFHRRKMIYLQESPF